MFNVSALLPDDAFLKCVVTEVVLFSVVAVKTLSFHKNSVATHLRCGGVFSDSTITNIFLILTVKQFENWLVFNEVIRRTKCANFWATLYMPDCICLNVYACYILFQLLNQIYMFIFIHQFKTFDRRIRVLSTVQTWIPVTPGPNFLGDPGLLEGA